MKKVIFTIFLGSLVIGRSQNSLVIKTNNPSKIFSNQQLSVAQIYGDYYLAHSTKPFTIDKSWIFSVRPKMANKHISFETNELIIRIKEELSEQQLNRLKSFGEIIKNPHNPSLCLIETMDKQIEGVIQKKEILKTYDFVKSVQVNQYFTLEDCSNDSLYSYQWYLENTGSPIQYNGLPGADININNAWSISKGDSIVVAIMDSGVDTLHPEFNGRLLPGFDAFATDSINTNGYPFLDYSQNAHGTACAGIVGAAQDNTIGISGIAPNVKLVPVRIFFYIALGTDIVPFTNMNALITGSAYSWNNMGADVMSCSAGLSPEYINLLTIDTTICNEELRLAYSQGRNTKGCVMLFSAGNDNINQVLWPGNMKESIAVGASDMCDTRKRPNDCSGENWWGSSYGNSLDLVAPGVKIATCDISGESGYTTNDYSLTFNGTSAACPIAAGVASLLLSENQTLTSDEVKHLLNVTSEKVSNYAYDSIGIHGTWNEEVGHGRINAHLALLQAYNASISNTHYENPFTVFPNPAKHSISIAGISDPTSFVIFDILGRIQRKGQVENSENIIYLESLETGAYFLRIGGQSLPFKIQ